MVGEEGGGRKEGRKDEKRDELLKNSKVNKLVIVEILKSYHDADL